jgi:hypothetical protein
MILSIRASEDGLAAREVFPEGAQQQFHREK